MCYSVYYNTFHILYSGWWLGGFIITTLLRNIQPWVPDTNAGGRHNFSLKSWTLEPNPIPEHGPRERLARWHGRCTRSTHATWKHPHPVSLPWPLSLQPSGNVRNSSCKLAHQRSSKVVSATPKSYQPLATSLRSTTGSSSSRSCDHRLQPRQWRPDKHGVVSTNSSWVARVSSTYERRIFNRSELQQRSSKIFEEHSTKHFL